MKKVLYITNTLASYRVSFFKKFNAICELTILFTDFQMGYDVYSENSRINEIEEINYVTIRTKDLLNLSKNGIDLQKYDYVILPAPDGKKGLLTSYLALIASKRSQKKTALFWIRWNADKCSVPWKQQFKNMLRNIAVRPIAHGVDSCICAGKKSYENFLKLGVNKDKIHMTHYANDIDVGSEDINVYDEYPVPPNKKYILYIGRIIERKGLLDLIIAFSNIKNSDYVLLIGGDGQDYLVIVNVD